MDPQSTPDPMTGDHASRLPPDDAAKPPSEAFGDLVARLGELADYARYYVAVRWGAIKLKIRNVALFAALGLLGAVIGATALVTATVLLSLGIARGLALLMGGRLWLGYLVFGLLVMILLGAGAWWGMRWLSDKSRHQTFRTFETMKRKQREQYGHDVRTKAAQRPQ